MTNNPGNTNNTNNTNSTNSTGNAGRSIDPGSEWTFADRVNLPLVDDPGMDGTPFPDSTYADRDWSPVWFAWRVLPEYVQLPWKNQSPGAPAPAGNELAILANYARFDRADALDEIMSQKDEFVTEFMGLLAITPSSHPNTYRVMHLANLFAAFTVLYFKGVYRRIRPSQRLPLLRPPIQVPGHASYPSGHATQAHLVAFCTTTVLPAAMVANSPPSLKTSLVGLADRIARNREIAGLHYPSDTAGGVALATNIFKMIEADRAKPPPTNPPAPGQQVMPSYGSAIVAAQEEWS